VKNLKKRNRLVRFLTRLRPQKKQVIAKEKDSSESEKVLLVEAESVSLPVKNDNFQTAYYQDYFDDLELKEERKARRSKGRGNMCRSRKRGYKARTKRERFSSKK
jgi:hypothetical protein